MILKTADWKVTKFISKFIEYTWRILSFRHACACRYQYEFKAANMWPTSFNGHITDAENYKTAEVLF